MSEDRSPRARIDGSSAEKHLWARRHGWERRLVLAHDKSLRGVDLARRFGVHPNTIYSIQQARRWAWLDETSAA